MSIDWDKVTKELQKPLSPDAIKPPPKGKFGEYVDALHVIREANRIFGHDGWSYTITRLEQTSASTVSLNGGNGPYEQFRTSWMCTVSVNVDGVERCGAAVGIGNGKPESMGDVIESAVKEAETDALKRALRSFGNTFGLALYDKDKDAREVGYAVPQEVLDAASGAETGESLLAVWNANKAQWGSAQDFKDAIAKRKAELKSEAAQNNQSAAE